MKAKWNGFRCERLPNGDIEVIAPDWYGLIRPSVFEVLEQVSHVFEMADDARDCQ